MKFTEAPPATQSASTAPSAAAWAWASSAVSVRISGKTASDISSRVEPEDGAGAAGPRGGRMGLTDEQAVGPGERRQH
jgi:hypothetical protein